MVLKVLVQQRCGEESEGLRPALGKDSFIVISLEVKDHVKAILFYKMALNNMDLKEMSNFHLISSHNG